MTRPPSRSPLRACVVRRTLQRFALWLLLAGIPACSLQTARYEVTLVSPSWEVDCHVWVDDPNIPIGYELLWDGLLFPVDGVLSRFWGSTTLFQSRRGVQGGPLGVLAAVLLPLVTCASPADRPLLRDRYSTTDERALDPSPLIGWRQTAGMKLRALQVVDIEVIERRPRTPADEGAGHEGPVDRFAPDPRRP